MKHFSDAEFVFLPRCGHWPQTEHAGHFNRLVGERTSGAARELLTPPSTNPWNITMKIRFGICGLGFAGSVLMGPDLNVHPDVELVAACDPNEDVRNRFTADHRIQSFGSLGEMLRETRPDAVYIASRRTSSMRRT